MRNIRWQKMALRAANGLLDGVTALLVLLAGLTVKVGRMLRVKNRFWYFLIGFSWCATFPFVRMSAVLGQPDWFGLIFAFMLMLLTLDSVSYTHLTLPTNSRV